MQAWAECALLPEVAGGRLAPWRPPADHRTAPAHGLSARRGRCDHSNDRSRESRSHLDGACGGRTIAIGRRSQAPVMQGQSRPGAGMPQRRRQRLPRPRRRIGDAWPGSCYEEPPHMTHETACLCVPLPGGCRNAAPDHRDGACPTPTPQGARGATCADAGGPHGTRWHSIRHRHMNAIALLQCGPRKCSIRGSFRVPRPTLARHPSTPTITAAGDRT